MSSVTERFNYISYSDSSKFETTEEGRIELVGYPDSLMMYASYDSTINATYAYGDETPLFSGTFSIENFGVFGQHVYIQDGSIKYEDDNFINLSSEGSIKWRMKAGFNNGYGYQEFKSTSAEVTAGDTYYEFKLFINGTQFEGDTDNKVLLATGDTITQIYTKLDTAIATSDADATMVDGRIRITATSDQGDSVSILPPTNGYNLVALLGGVYDNVIPNGPIANTPIIDFYNDSGDSDRIRITHTTDSDIIVEMFDSNGDTQVYKNFGVWSNYFLNWHSFEFDWNEAICQLFIDGQPKGVESTGFSRGSNTYLYVKADQGDSYRFDELIIHNEYQNTKSYTVETENYSQYDTATPYVDINFGTGFKESEIVDLNLVCSSGCHFVVALGGNWYYYLSGAWRSSDGSFAQSVDPGILETKFPDFFFVEDAELKIRAYFDSDGETEVYLDEIEIVKEIGTAQSAIITGSVDLSSTTVDLSTNYNVIITTDKGAKEVDASAGAGDSAFVTLSEIKTAINAASVPGLVVADNGKNLVLSSTTTGDSSYVAIDNGTTNDALSLIWGYEATDYGEAATGVVVDYSEMYRWVRVKLGEPTIPVELTDEQIEDCIASSVWHYNRWRTPKENLLYTTLEGSAKNGYDIPAIVGGSDNIIEIIIKPRFPFTYYAGRTDLITNLYVQFLFQKYTAGFTNALSDYYLTFTTEEDINIILGTQTKWEILNNKIFIWPELDDTSLQIGIRYKGALSAEEVVNNQWIKDLTLAEAKIVLGNIRSTFKSGIPGGTEMIQLNGEDLKQEGMQEKQVILEDLKKMAEPTFLYFF